LPRGTAPVAAAAIAAGRILLSRCAASGAPLRFIGITSGSELLLLCGGESESSAAIGTGDLFVCIAHRMTSFFLLGLLYGHPIVEGKK